MPLVSVVHSADCAALRYGHDSHTHGSVRRETDGSGDGRGSAAGCRGMTCAQDIAKVLEVLRLLWDDEYQIGHDDDLGWSASRRGVIGHLITANSPEELGQMIGDDFGPGR